MKTKIEIEEADNGYSMRVWKESDKDEDDSKSDFGYHEPKVLVATEIEEVLTQVKKTFK